MTHGPRAFCKLRRVWELWLLLRIVTHRFRIKRPKRWKGKTTETNLPAPQLCPRCPVDTSANGSPNQTGSTIPSLINIVGFPKAGTSHLYRIIASHPEVEHFGPVKEFCMPKNASLEVMFNFCKRVAGDRRKKTVNGCFRQAEVSRWWLYLRQPRTKVIFIFRDPAAWLWAAFNFWFIQDFDAPASPQPNWAGSNQYRASELFHEGIVSGSRTSLGLFLNEFRYQSVVNPRQWIAMLGRIACFLSKVKTCPQQIPRD